jgi:hypothetical protein
MDANNLLSLLINNQYRPDLHTQLEVEERSRIAQIRRDIETHELELQAQIAERSIAL